MINYFLKCTAFQKHLLLILIVINKLCFSQGVAINTSGSAPNSSSMLDITSSSKGILIPRMTDTQKDAITSPSIGLTIFQIDGNAVGEYTYDGASWEMVTPWRQHELSGIVYLKDNAANVGIGSLNPTTKLDIIHNDGSTSIIMPVMKLVKATTGTAANGLGTSIRYDIENNAGNIIECGRLKVALNDVTATSEDSRFLIDLVRNGNMIEVMRISGNDGNLSIGTTTSGARIDVVTSGNTGASKSMQIINAVGAGIFTLLDDGRLGINDMSPQAPLVVRINPPTGTGIFELSRTTLTNATGNGANNFRLADTYYIEDDAGNIEEQTRINHELEIATNTAEVSSMSFQLRTNGGGVSEMVRFDGSLRYVGINEPTPDGDIDVSSGGTQTQIIIDNTNGGADEDPLLKFQIGGSSVWTLGADDGASDKFIIAASDDLGSNPRFTIQPDGKIGIGTTTPASTLSIVGNVSLGNTVVEPGATNTLVITQGANPTSGSTDAVQLYAEDIAGNAELKVRDESGNITTLSPHNFSLLEKSEPMAWSYYSENTIEGKIINVDMLKALRILENLSGEKLIFIVKKEQY